MGYDAVGVGARVRTLREAAGLSQRALARETERLSAPVSHGTISQIERGERKRRSDEVLDALALALGERGYGVFLTASGGSPPVGTHTLDTTSLSSGITDAAATAADDATHRGAVWRPRRLYRAVTWGSWIDPLNPLVTDPPARPYPEVTLVDDDDIERVGRHGFAMIVNCDLLSNWAQPTGRRVGPRWTLWVNPDKKDAAIPGAAIAYRHPTLGNVALLLEQDGDGLYVTTDVAGEAMQARWPYEEERLLGAVVLATPPPAMLLRLPVTPTPPP